MKSQIITPGGIRAPVPPVKLVAFLIPACLVQLLEPCVDVQRARHEQALREVSKPLEVTQSVLVMLQIN